LLQQQHDVREIQQHFAEWQVGVRETICFVERNVVAFFIILNLAVIEMLQPLTRIYQDCLKQKSTPDKSEVLII
jgi:hypothetical protein